MSKKWTWTGRVLSWLSGLFVLTSGLNLLFVHSPDLLENFVRFGYPEKMMPAVGMAALVASLLYLIPMSSVLGALLLTGYLGGAIATHVRISDPTFLVPLMVGILAWLGLFLREERLRVLLPLRH